VNYQFWGDGSQIQGLTNIQFADGVSWNRSAISDAVSTFNWVGSPSNAMLTGNNYGANIFQFGAGTETAIGGARKNVYQASTGTGQADIVLPTSAGSANELDFVGGITDNNLWFQRSGNDLMIDLLGTQTQVDVGGWFSNNANPLQEITAGGLKLDGQISQLVQAMATYSANHAGFDPTTSSLSSIPNDTSVQTALGSTWHS
jgi:hypothetical protein